MALGGGRGGHTSSGDQLAPMSSWKSVKRVSVAVSKDGHHGAHEVPKAREWSRERASWRNSMPNTP